MSLAFWALDAARETIGVYSLRNNSFDLYVMVAAACISFVLVKLDCEPAPFLLGFVLGPMLEENLRRAMLLAHGDVISMVSRPITAGLLLVGVVVIVCQILPGIQRQKQHIAAD